MFFYKFHRVAPYFLGLSVREVDVLLNATPMGSAGVPISKEILQLIGSTKVVFDAVYLPRETELLQAARRSGCEAIYGYEMFLWQATAAFELWTGLKAPSEAMRLVLLDFLGRRDIE
jgi:shikimate dehydrogenase